jgi:hypothetical protein
MPQRHALIARIMQMRRRAAASDPRSPAEAPHRDAAALGALEARIAHLEKLVEGLQDSVHRESTRQSRRIAEVEAQVQPAALAVAISRDRRERGL